MTYTQANEKAKELTLMARRVGLLDSSESYIVYADMFVKQLCIKKRFGEEFVIQNFKTFKDLYTYILDKMDDIRCV